MSNNKGKKFVVWFNKDGEEDSVIVIAINESEAEEKFREEYDNAIIEVAQYLCV